MMKKFLALMLALVMALSLVACGQKNQDSNGTYDTDKDTDVTDVDRKSTRLNSSHASKSRMPSSA